MRKVLAGLTIVVVSLFVMSTPTVFAQPCEGNFDCDEDVDGTDAAVFKADFGRSPFKNPCPACPPPAPVPKTGQHTSYYEGDDGDLEKGLAWTEPRFTDNEDGTVTDNLTGLIWLENANCYGPQEWYDALTNCNALANGQCGLTDGSSGGDWRLPNIREFLSLLDYEYYEPVLSNSAGTGQWTFGDPFINLQTSAGDQPYWTSTTSRATITDSSIAVYMYGGSLHFGSRNNVNWFVWCVRGGH